jgi:carboxyl-terminal processing protease
MIAILPERSFVALSLLLAAFSLAACVAPFPPVPEAENADRIERMLVEAYEDAGEAYNGEVSISEMALAGLDNLKAVDPGLAIHGSGPTVTLNLGAETFYSFDRPADETADDWAEAVSGALVALHRRSGQVQRTDPQQIYDSYMAGLASVLGSDSRYFPSEEFYGYLYADVDGLIDLSYTQTEDGLRVVSLDQEGDLAAAGLAVNDIITHIDGTATAGRSQFEVYSLLRGPVNSNIILTILRDGQPSPARVIARRKVLEPRSYKLTRSAGVIVYGLPSLNEYAANLLSRSLAQETSRGASGATTLKGIVLDLRGDPDSVPDAVTTPSVTLGVSRPDWSNVVGYIDTGFMTGPGGSPDAARRLVTAFTSKGVVYRQQGKQDTANFVVEAGGTNPSSLLPMIVIVDSTTIGGAEIAAAGLQDSGRALVIGTTTGGYGVIRKNVSLYNLGVINLPWARALAPSGYALAGRGVLPQVCTSLDDATVDHVMAMLRQGKGLTEPADRARLVDPDDAAAVAAQRRICPGRAGRDDVLLGLAAAILAEPALYARLMGGTGS